MLIFNHRLNKWDVIVVIVGVVAAIRFIINGIILESSHEFCFAIFTVIVLVMYVKIAQFYGRL